VQASGPGTGGADEQMPLHDGSVHGGGRVLGEGDAVGEIAFFTDVPHSGSVRTLSVARVLCVPRARYEIIANDFPVGTRAVLENLRQRAQAVVDREFAGDAGAARLAAAPAGLQHMRASAEGSARGGVSKSGLTCAQERALGDALRVKALAAAALARADERRTQEFLSAASRGDATVVRLMLQQGMSPDSCDYDGRVALELAAAAGHGLVIDELLAAACNVNAVDNLGGSALLEAAKGSQDAIVAKLRDSGAVWHLSTVETAAELCAAVFAMNLPLLQRFLKAGARPDAGDYDERTAAHIAACENSLAALKALHEAGADVSLPDRWGSTPLDEAIRVGARPAIDFLVSAGASSLREEARVAEFLAAAARGDCDKLRHMLAHGMAVDAVDYDGRGALVLASKSHIDAVATLLGANADPNLVDCFGGCCLLEAVTARRRDVLALLKAAGARLPWTEGETASRLCTAVGDGDADLLALYLEAGAAPSAGDYDRRCALAIASADGVEAAVRTLLGAGADVNMRDRWNATPLDEAVKAGHDGVAAILVAAGGELGATGCALAGVLCEAVKSGDVALLTRYADAGADLSAFDYDARAALHIAAAEGAAAAVALLVERGADAAAVDRWGATPLAEAKREGRREVVRLLEAAGVRA
jgi:ankyrin repeat protein